MKSKGCETVRRIETDEQYFRSLDWLLEKAKELDHPLMNPESKAALMQKYDFVANAVMEYQQRKTVPASAAGPEQTASINLSDWLDDD